MVIGAGFIGLEFAAVARSKGKPVRILELTDRVMGRVVCPVTSEFFGAAHRHNGVEFSFGAQAVRIAAHASSPMGGRVDHVELASGERLEADLVLVSIGVVPNGELAAAAGLAVANGIVAECGGSCMCATCHVYVREDQLAQTPAMQADEDAMLEGTASPRKPNSRLSCQLVVSPQMEGLVVYLPETQT